ncbi:MAG TPA: helix-turn-helix domain-containing protein [Terracidiphilus sp.]|jgi:predicted DNA-binding transcriptional regulator AlpA
MVQSTPKITQPTAVLIGDEMYYDFASTLAMLGIHERTYHRWEARGDAPPRTAIGKTLLFRKSALVEWLRSREESTPGRICANGHRRKPAARVTQPLRRRARRAA